MSMLVQRPPMALRATPGLPASKSLANRALIIRALCSDPFLINNLSSAQDTRILEALLDQPAGPYDAGDAGTAFRFSTALLACREGEHQLTGSARMLQRPIGPLVDALRLLGAEIDYLGKEGYPPLRIRGGKLKGGAIRIDASMSSQYTSALMMIGPVLENGLELELTGDIVSRSYLEMTQQLMQQFGARCGIMDNYITVEPSPYRAKDYRVEPDWSAASYWFAMTALAGEGQLALLGLQERSVQGDSVMEDLAAGFGVRCRPASYHLELNGLPHDGVPLEIDCLLCPDIAQTLAVIAAGQQRELLLTGLQTLTIKETDRIAALKTELEKLGAKVAATKDTLQIVKGIDTSIDPPPIATYGDHRMAMAFAPLAMVYPQGIRIEAPDVVKKSYPEFWDELRSAGFTCRES